MTKLEVQSTHRTTDGNDERRLSSRTLALREAKVRVVRWNQKADDCDTANVEELALASAPERRQVGWTRLQGYGCRHDGSLAAGSDEDSQPLQQRSKEESMGRYRRQQDPETYSHNLRALMNRKRLFDISCYSTHDERERGLCHDTPPSQEATLKKD
jgi:hypothetical protein